MFASVRDLARTSGDLHRVDTFRSRTGRTIAVTVGAVIPPHQAARMARSFGKPPDADKHDYQEVLEWVLEDDRVDAFRVGLEDTPVLYGEKRSNPELVKSAARMISDRGTIVETDPFRVQRIFLKHQSAQ